ncbi:WD40 repeat domain-containing protein [Eisenibacter elegans]|uniref:WD40 repeat domain-containing protein n=1 Tax=Eisenibacter elegans TaxID=997 RepID=UPI00054E4CEC|nr:WD-40 repeat protein [Eisenibacter elegans]
MKLIQVDKLETLSGHRDCIYALVQGESPNIFYTADGTGLVARWDLLKPEMGQPIAQVAHAVYALCMIPGSNQLIVGHNTQGIHLIDTQAKKELYSVKLTDAAIFDIQVQLPYAYIACGDGVVIVFDLMHRAVRQHLKASHERVRALALHPTAPQLAVGYSDAHIRVFDTEHLNPLYDFEAHQNSVFTLQYSPDGQHLVSGGRDAHLAVWSATEHYSPKAKIAAHLYALNSLCFSPSGRFMASGSMDKSVKIWDTQEWQLLKVIDKARHAGHGTSVNKVLWTNHQGQLLSAGDDRLISLWDVKFKY